VEWACIEAFDNAEFAPLGVDEVEAIGAESRLALQPHVQLLALDYRADDLVLEMHRKQGDAYAPLRLRKRVTWLAVHRADFSLYYKRLTRPEYQTLCAIRDGLTLPEALGAGFADSRLSIAKQVNLVRQWFANWAELGWICKSYDVTERKEG
jgi:hypothetical protein